MSSRVVVASSLVLAACGLAAPAAAPPGPTATAKLGAAPPAGGALTTAHGPTAPARPAGPLPLGCRDRGVYSDLDPHVIIGLPDGLDPRRVAVVVDPTRATLVLYADDWPVKAYPLVEAGEALALGDRRVQLRGPDLAELAPFVPGRPVRWLAAGERVPPGDRDEDGLPDPLDVLVGGKKLVANGAAYTGEYFPLSYPGGDAPRDRGSCADVVIRALRNAGIDLQVAIHEDLARAPRAYPMVKKPDPSIDHRRVRTMRPWFERHMEARGTDPADTADPFRPGDILFLDTIASRAGADHVGVVSDRRGESCLPLVINNWTDGTVDAEMDLLGWVPVVARYRLPAQ